MQMGGGPLFFMESKRGGLLKIWLEFRGGPRVFVLVTGVCCMEQV